VALRLAVLAAMILGLAATGWGLYIHGSGLLPSVWKPAHVAQALWVLVLGGIIFGVGVISSRPAFTVSLLVVVAAVAFGIGAVVATALTFLVAFLLGWVLLRWVDRRREPDGLMALPTGIGLMVLVLPAFGIAGVQMRPVFWILLAAGLSVLFYPSERMVLKNLMSCLLTAQVPNIARWIPLWLITAWLIFALAHASLPERVWDVFVTHLMVPNQIVSFGRWSHPPEEMLFAVFPMGANYLFAFAMELGGEAAVRLLNFALLLGILALTRDILRDLCGPAMQDIGILLLLGMPLLLAVTASPFVENTVALLAVATVRTLLRCEGPASRQAIMTLALILPGMAAVKLHGAVVAAAALPLGLWRLRAARQPLASWLPVAGLAAATCALGFVQYANAWWRTGNPVLPFFNNIFHSPLWPLAAFEDQRWTGKLTFDLLYEMTFRTTNFVEAYPGAIGFGALALLFAGGVATVLVPSRAALLSLAVAAPSVLLILVQTQYARYFLFAWPLFVVMMVHGLVQVGRLPFARVPTAGVGLAVAVGGFLVLPSGIWTLVTADLRGAYDPVVRQAVAMQVPARLASEIVNAMSFGRPRVIYGSTPYGANLRGWPIYTQWYNLPVATALSRSSDPAAIDSALSPLRGDFVIAQVPPADANEAQLIAYAERRGRIVGEVGQIKIWRLQP